MKRHYVTYTERWEPGPMRYWVHQPADGDPAYRSMAFETPVPGPIPGKGYPPTTTSRLMGSHSSSHPLTNSTPAPNCSHVSTCHPR